MTGSETLELILKVNSGPGVNSLRQFQGDFTRAMQQVDRDSARMRRSIEGYQRTMGRTPARTRTSIELFGMRRSMTEVMRYHRELQMLPAMRRTTITVIDRGTRTLQKIERATDRVGRAAMRATGYLGLGAGVGLGAALAYGVRVGREYNQVMQGAEISIRQLLTAMPEFADSPGKAREATQGLLSDMRELARLTPIATADIVSGGQRLLSSGLALKEVIPTLKGLAAGTAMTGNVQNWSSVILSAQQMMAAGTLKGGELNQMASAGIPAFKILREQMHLSNEEMGKIGELGLSSDKVLKVLSGTLSKQFAPAMKEAAHTRKGLEGGFKSLFSMIAGGLVEPFDRWEKEALLRINPAMRRIRDKFASDPSMSVEAKIDFAWNELVKTGVPGEVKDALVDGGIDVGKKLAEAVWSGFKAAPLWAKGAIGVFLASKVAGSGLGTAILNRTGRARAGGALAGTAGSFMGATPVYVVNMGPGGGIGGGAGTMAGRVGRGAGLGVAALAPATAGGALGLGAAVIGGGIVLNQLDNQYHFMSADPAVEQKKMKERIAAMIAAWRESGPRLEKVIKEHGSLQTLIMQQGGTGGQTAGEIRDQVQKMTTIMQSELVHAGPKVRNSFKSLMAGTDSILAQTPKAFRKLAADSILQMVAGLERAGAVPKNSTARLTKQIESEIGKLPPRTEKIAVNTAKAMKKLEPAAKGTAGKVAGSFDSMSKAVARSLANIRSQVGTFENDMGVSLHSSEPTRDQAITGGSSFATGGRIPGKARGDHIPLLSRAGGVLGIADGGELVVNRHTERDVNRFLAPYGMTLGGLVGREGRPHFATGGRIAGARAWAEAQMGKPYVWGAGHSFGTWPSYDCSGFATNAGVRAGYSGGIGTTYTAMANSHKGKSPVMFGFSHFGAKGNEGPGHMGIMIGKDIYQFGNPGHKGGSFPVWLVPNGIEGLDMKIKTPPWTGPGGRLGRDGRTEVAQNVRLAQHVVDSLFANPPVGLSQADLNPTANPSVPNRARGGRLRFGGFFANGGLLTADQPTALVIGESGPETAVVVPHGKGSTKSSAKLPKADKIIEEVQAILDAGDLRGRLRGYDAGGVRGLENVLKYQKAAIAKLMKARAELAEALHKKLSKKKRKVVESDKKDIDRELLGLTADRRGNVKALAAARTDLVRTWAQNRLGRATELGSSIVQRAEWASTIRGDSEVQSLQAHGMAVGQELKGLQSAYNAITARFVKERQAHASKQVLKALLDQIQAADDAIQSARADYATTQQQISEAIAAAHEAARQAVVDGIQKSIDTFGQYAALIDQDVNIVSLEQQIAGTDIASFQELKSKQGGSLTAAQIQQARDAQRALNAQIQHERSNLVSQHQTIQNNLGNANLTADDRLSLESQLRSVVLSILQLDLTMKNNDKSLQDLTEATQENTDATTQLSGTVSFSYRGQDYVLRNIGPSSDSLVSAGVGM